MLPSLTVSDLRARSAGLEENRFVIGQDAHGRWVALEVHGRGGGLFRDRQAAWHYAAAETGRRPDAVSVAGGLIELRA